MIGNALPWTTWYPLREEMKKRTKKKQKKTKNMQFLFGSK